MKILEEEDGRLPGAARAGEPPDQVEELPLPRLGTEGRSRPLGIWHAEEVEHERQPVGERLVEQEHPPGDLVARRSGRVLFGDPEVVAEELEDREQTVWPSRGRPRAPS